MYFCVAIAYRPFCLGHQIFAFHFFSLKHPSSHSPSILLLINDTPKDLASGSIC